MAFLNGVDTESTQISMAGIQIGSDSLIGYEDFILVATSGAVIKVTTVSNTTTANYVVVLGTSLSIQAGFQYPHVFRVLEPDADTNSEYYYYNNGGSYPWRSLYPNLLLTPNTEMGNY